MMKVVPWTALVLGVMITIQGSSCGEGQSQGLQQRVQEKAQEVESRAPSWIVAGGDTEKFGALAQQLDAHVKAGGWPEADRVLDEILGLLDQPPAGRAPSSSGGAITEATVEKKLREFQARSSEWIAAGGDSTRIQNFAERMDERLKAQDLEGANKLLDEILAMVESTHDADATPVAPRAGAAEPRPASLRAVPVGAAIVFHKSQHIYVSKADGTDVTQITFDNPRRYEHVAVSSDRTKLAANYYAESGGESSRLVIYDLEKGTETELVPYFEMAGSGGIDWDPSGYIYFAGVEENPVARPQSPQELKANMGANDIYRIRYDGADLNRVTHTLDRGEADVSVSEDGRLITYAALDFNSMDHRTEIWVNNADGSAPHLVFRGGEVRVSSVHDPEFSSDNRRLVFSQVNPDFRNFRNDPAADTAHDLCIIEVDGSGFRRLTKPGPISMIPDWSGDRIVFTELSDRENPPYMGIAFIMSDGSGYRRIVPGGNSAKWIPEPR